VTMLSWWLLQQQQQQQQCQRSAAAHPSGSQRGSSSRAICFTLQSSATRGLGWSQTT
jgi:hypothetical protein